jgi:hypothetical protein
MQTLRTIFAVVLAASLVTMPAMAAPAASNLGTVIAAERAHVGEASAEIGTTVFGGDRLSTEMQGSVQVRVGAARLLLLSSSGAVINDTDSAPSAKLLRGTATFSTANANAFTLFAASAAVKAATNAPTIGQVSYVSDKELVVRAMRGGLVVTVDGESQAIAEGTAYRVLLDQPADPAQGPAGAGGSTPGSRGGPPLRAGRSRFLIVTVAITAIVTYLAVSESLESPSRP